MSDFDPAAAAPPPAAGAPSSDDRTLALLTHLSGIVLGFIVPLIIWLINKDKPDKSFVIDQSKEALNFNILLAIIYLVLIVLSVPLTLITLGLFALVSPLIFFLVWAAAAVFFILAGVAANRGERYRYPLSLRLIK